MHTSNAQYREDLQHNVNEQMYEIVVMQQFSTDSVETVTEVGIQNNLKLLTNGTPRMRNPFFEQILLAFNILRYYLRN